MTRDEVNGQHALDKIERYVAPQPLFIARDHSDLSRKLYDLEEHRTKTIRLIAETWAKLAEVPKGEYWTRTIPQVLHDTLENYETPAAIVACETFLKRHGWTVTRPERKL